MDFLRHALRLLDPFHDLRTVTVPSAFVDDAQVDAWTRELYAADMANEPQTRTGEGTAS